MPLTDWSTDPPTRVGWYNASACCDPECRRYWDGSQFSAPCFVGDPDSHAERARATRGESQLPSIEWRGLTEPRTE